MSYSGGGVIKFVPFTSSVDSSFWVRYCREKLETIKLDEAPIRVSASYMPALTLKTGTTNNVSLPRLQCQENSLLLRHTNPEAETVYHGRVTVYGNLIGYNTLEMFQQVDKNVLLRNYFLQSFLPKDKKDDGVENVADILNPFILITFADLKSHKVLYWFGIPALVPLSGSIQAIECSLIKAYWDTSQYEDFANAFYLMNQNEMCLVPYFIYSPKAAKCLPLSAESYEILIGDYDVSSADGVIIGYIDPVGDIDSSLDGPSVTMGWPLRNLIAFLSFHLDLGGKTVQIMSHRFKSLVKKEGLILADDKSQMLKVRINTKEDYGWLSDSKKDVTEQFERYKVLGWELNTRSKPGPRSVNLRPLLDSNHLAIQAADLNLKLMKWRMIPDLNVEKLQACRVLIIGAGTLGCSTARTLLGWGIRKIKFVDFGKVSYSNPVRQNLFTLDDCHADSGTGKSKAVAAADSLKSIAADVESEGIVLSIPMPGHPSENPESLQKIIETLDTLVLETDVVFLLTDTRESRWLPTVMAAAHNKMLINAALGLDSWLVMRHGGGILNETQQIQQKQRYGCYFCNDVVAPEDSTKNRTLDQQCTVTRPGLAPIASSMAVELMVSLLHHSDYLLAPAPTITSRDFSPGTASGPGSGPLGIIPHQIRGSLVSYTMMIPTVPAFSQCTACSEPIIEAYRYDKLILIQEACESKDGSYLEQLSGLEEFRKHAEATMDEIDDDWDGDDEEVNLQN